MRTALTGSALALILATTTWAAAPVQASEPGRTIILNAFGNAEGTFGESKPFINAMSGKVDKSASSAYCQGVYDGTISGQPVTVVVTGTAGGNAGPCMQEILGMYDGRIREVIWSGIAGATPAVGGLVDSQGKLRPKAKHVMIGDTCISPLAWNYDLHFSNVTDWALAHASKSPDSPTHGWWPMVDSTGKETVPGFQGIQQFVVADKALSDELIAASASATAPTVPISVKSKIKRYFASKDIRPARTFDYTQCAEISSDNFWHGPTEDLLSRQYLAGLINHSGYRTGSKAAASDVVTFSAMEAVPWMSAVARWNEHYGTTIPMSVVRAASNYDQNPFGAKGKNGKPLSAMKDILLGFDDFSADYASASAAAPVLTMLSKRAAAS